MCAFWNIYITKRTIRARQVSVLGMLVDCCTIDACSSLFLDHVHSESLVHQPLFCQLLYNVNVLSMTCNNGMILVFTLTNFIDVFKIGEKFPWCV